MYTMHGEQQDETGEQNGHSANPLQYDTLVSAELRDGSRLPR